MAPPSGTAGKGRGAEHGGAGRKSPRRMPPKMEEEKGLQQKSESRGTSRSFGKRGPMKKMPG